MISFDFEGSFSDPADHSVFNKATKLERFTLIQNKNQKNGQKFYLFYLCVKFFKKTLKGETPHPNWQKLYLFNFV